MKVNRRDFIRGLITGGALSVSELSQLIGVKDENRRWKTIELKDENNSDFPYYEIEIAKDSDFINILYQGYLNRGSFIFEIPQNIKVYARVRKVYITGGKGIYEKLTFHTSKNVY